MIHQTNFNVMQLAHGGLLRHSVTELCRGFDHVMDVLPES